MTLITYPAYRKGQVQLTFFSKNAALSHCQGQRKVESSYISFKILGMF